MVQSNLDVSYLCKLFIQMKCLKTKLTCMLYGFIFYSTKEMLRAKTYRPYDSHCCAVFEDWAH